MNSKILINDIGKEDCQEFPYCLLWSQKTLSYLIQFYSILVLSLNVIFQKWFFIHYYKMIGIVWSFFCIFCLLATTELCSYHFFVVPGDLFWTDFNFLCYWFSYIALLKRKRLIHLHFEDYISHFLIFRWLSYIYFDFPI